jgi:dTDP-4-dehydrorhamnose 3,5-epimerase-like enzyme
VVVDATGVAFEMGALSADFPWQVIRGVHYRASTDGKMLIMAVVHVDGRMFECVVDAKRRERLQEWFAGLAAVLGHYRPAG